MRRLVAVGVGVAVAHRVTYRYWRERCITWGATPGERVAHLPGDDLLPDADVVTTRAMRVDAPPSAVWPWLVQMGPGRAGAYTYDWIENLLGLGMHSADELLPQFQHLEPDDAIRLGNHGAVLRVALLEHERTLVLASDDGRWVWAFVRTPEGAGTRLVSRNRIAVGGESPLVRAATTYRMEPGSLLMERKMLRGIAERAGRLAVEQHRAAAHRAAGGREWRVVP